MIKSRIVNYIARNLSSVKNNGISRDISFETVYSLPLIKYIATINRLKVYHFIGTGIALPTCSLLEIFNAVPNNSFLTASYIGVTGAIVLSLASFPLRNTIGFLYVSEDNKFIKISSVDYWGRRKDKIINSNDWIPMFDLSPKVMDGIYRTPQLSDGTKYKLFVRFGKIVNGTKMAQVLE
ncbi:transmembrane protein 186 [Battus philenor]|uniref:transmembrane protein 186 n=1 Tax=Battus philenor TaxID=42288 RepID=UPI0035D0517C